MTAPRTTRRAAGIAAVVAGLLLPATAFAAAPANDAPQGAVDVAAVTAENGAVLERQGVAELLEATADAGVPRCLGARSFARTTWFRVPATATPVRLRLEAFSPSGGPDATPDLAAYVQGATPNTTLPQACDGAATKAVPDAGAAVELDVPENRAVLVQVGAPDDSPLTQVVLAAGTDALPLAAAPVGDVARRAKILTLGRARLIPLGAARLTAEDPATPACPSPGSVWRQTRIRQTGLQVAAANGPGVGALTVFLGRRPSLTNGAACAPGTDGLVEVPFRARRGQRAWVRIGTTTPEAPTARLAVSGPCQQTPLRPVKRTRIAVTAPKNARRARAVRLRLALRGPCVRRARVVVRQGGEVVARGTVRRLVRGSRVVAIRRVGRVRAGRAQVVVRAPKARTRATLRLR